MAAADGCVDRPAVCCSGLSGRMGEEFLEDLGLCPKGDATSGVRLLLDDFRSVGIRSVEFWEAFLIRCADGFCAVAGVGVLDPLPVALPPLLLGGSAVSAWPLNERKVSPLSLLAIAIALCCSNFEKPEHSASHDGEERWASASRLVHVGAENQRVPKASWDRDAVQDQSYRGSESFARAIGCQVVVPLYVQGRSGGVVGELCGSAGPAVGLSCRVQGAVRRNVW